MKKKAQAIILKMMMAIIIFIIVMIMIQPIKENIDSNTNTSQLNCSSTTISEANNATCIVMDFALFYLIGAALSVGMAFIAGQKDINGVITAIVIFVIVNILINPLKDFIIIARDSSHLNCAASSLSVATRLSCIIVGLWLFWFVAVVLSASLTYIFVKKVLKKE